MQSVARNSLPATLLLLLALFGVANASAKDNVPEALAGKWRGEFAAAEQNIPFNFEIKPGTAESARLTLVNGARRDEFKLVSRGEGAYAVPLGNYDSELQLQVQPDGSLSGRYHYLAAERQANDLPFTATRGKDWRFVPASADKTAIDLNGSWRFSTTTARGAREQIGVFKQHGNHLTGVLQSPTGDSRALEGNIVGDEFFLSGFTGPAPSYYRGKLGEAPQTLAGSVVARGTAQPFTAVLDNTAVLPDPFTLTTAASTEPVTLAFPDASGKTVTLDDPRYRGKVVVLQILGTWCPNSRTKPDSSPPGTGKTRIVAWKWSASPSSRKTAWSMHSTPCRATRNSMTSTTSCCSVVAWTRRRPARSCRGSAR